MTYCEFEWLKRIEEKLDRALRLVGDFSNEDASVKDATAQVEAAQAQIPHPQNPNPQP